MLMANRGGCCYIRYFITVGLAVWASRANFGRSLLVGSVRYDSSIVKKTLSAT